ncbi:MAG: copper-binding protein [Pyrinomonadaceae bacterium]
MNRKVFVFSVLAIAACIFLIPACSKETATSGIESDTKRFNSKGVVVKIDKDAGRVAIKHEEIPGLMSAMTMEKPVASLAILDSVTAGDEVEFELEKTGDQIVFTKITVTGKSEKQIGADLYLNNCSKCHGPNGNGTDRGISLIEGHALDHGEDEMLARVKNGKPNKMPPFKEKLSEEEMKKVVKYVRETIQKNRKPDNEKAETVESKPHSH